LGTGKWEGRIFWLSAYNSIIPSIKKKRYNVDVYVDFTPIGRKAGRVRQIRVKSAQPHSDK
jgi:hypothetical protein